MTESNNSSTARTCPLTFDTVVDGIDECPARGEEEEEDNDDAGTTDSFPYHNPFGNAFHGYITHSRTVELLTQDGHFLVRKRKDDPDEEYVLSFR